MGLKHILSLKLKKEDVAFLKQKKEEDVVFLMDEKSTESRDGLCTVTIL